MIKKWQSLEGLPFFLSSYHLLPGPLELEPLLVAVTLVELLPTVRV